MTPATASARIGRRGLAMAGVTALLLCFAAQAVLSMRQKAVTVDEIMYIAAGYYHLRTGDFELNMTNPPLMKVVAGLPLLLLDPSLPALAGDPSDWTAIEEWQYARRFLYENTIDADRLLFVARLPFVALGMLLGLLVFLWSRELYGPIAGLVSLTLYSFSPSLLAHTRFATQDLGVALVVFATVYCFWRYSRSGRWSMLVASAVLFGLAILTKTTAAFVAVVIALFFAVSALRGAAFTIDPRFPWVAAAPTNPTWVPRLVTALWIGLLHAAVAVLLVNLGYGFQGSFAGLPLVPSAFEKSLLFQMQLGANSGGMFFAGRLFDPGLRWIVFPTVAIKTPLPVLLLAGAVVIRLLRQRRVDAADSVLGLGIGVFLALFVVFYNLGSIERYVLAIYPFLFVWIGSLTRVAWPRPKLFAGALSLLLLWNVVGTVRVFPHYLPYCNELIGGPANGYKWIAESNLDWGQDLKGLATYLKEKGIERIPLAYFGSADARYYGIDYDYLPSVGLQPNEPGQQWWYERARGQSDRDVRRPGLMAVSVSLIQRTRWIGTLFGDTYSWLEEFEPIDTIGHSIHIYEIPPDDPEPPGADAP